MKGSCVGGMAGVLVAAALWWGAAGARGEAAASQPTSAAAGSNILPAEGKPVRVKTTPGKIVEFTHDMQTLRAYWVTPEGAGPWPGVVVAHDIYGLNGWIRKQADGLAGQGYAVVVPDLYSRLAASDGCGDARTAWDCYVQMPDQQAMGDLRAAVDFLAEHPSVGAGQRIGVVGYDMGGIYAMMLAATDLRVKAAVNYYGQVIYSRISKDRPVSAAETMFNLRAPLLSFYGNLDPQSPQENVQKLESRLAHNPNSAFYQIVRYPQVGHGFLVETRQGYNAAAAADARQKTREFLARILHAPPEKPEE